MSNKYSDEELRAMAMTMLRHKEEGDLVYNRFCMALAHMTSKSLAFVEAEIVRFSNLEVGHE